MKLTVIGFRGGYPGPDEAASTYLLEKDNFKMVIDFGSGGLLKIQKYIHVTGIDAVVLSNYHADHVSDIGVLQHALIVEAQVGRLRNKVSIYGHDKNIEEFNKLTDDYTLGIAYEQKRKLKIRVIKINYLNK